MDGYTVIHQDQIAADDADVLNHLAVRWRPQCRETQRERQGVYRGPCDFGDRYLGMKRIVTVLDVRQSHGVTVFWIGVRRVAGLRADDFLEDQHIAGV